MKLLLLTLSYLVVVASARAETKELSVGDTLPDCDLIDQAGKVFHLREYKGQARAITFIFTRCPLPAYCPRIAEHFLEVQHDLQKNQTAASWHLLSLSFDPEHDTPAQLSAYATAHQADGSQWTFATGKPGVVIGFGASFGLTAIMEEGLLNHNLRTVVVDRGGHVQHIFKGGDWTAKDLAWEMRKALLVNP